MDLSNDYIVDLKDAHDIGVHDRDAARNIEAFKVEHAQHSNADYSPQLKLKSNLHSKTRFPTQGKIKSVSIQQEERRSGNKDLRRNNASALSNTQKLSQLS